MALTDLPDRIEAPFDSGDYAKSVLIQDGNERADTRCGKCGLHGDDFPKLYGSYGVPAAMYRADIFCADCCPYSFNEYTGERVRTLTGMP